VRVPIGRLRAWMASYVDGQYRRPAGPAGRWVARQMVRQHAPEMAWTLALLNAQPADRILEIGFGPGAAIEQLSRTVTQGQVAGVDFSKTMVSVARRRNARAVKAGHVDLRHGDVSRLPFADGSFDKAFGIHTVYFWPDPVAGLGELWRVLRPSGYAVITVLPKESWSANPDGTLGTPQCIPYSGEEIATMMRQAGFSRTSVEADARPEMRSSYSVVGMK
jgi:SAM-dependent methyltransferase